MKTVENAERSKKDEQEDRGGKEKRVGLLSGLQAIHIMCLYGNILK